MEEQDTSIKIVTKKAYGIFQKLFCCRCFHCLQADDESMLTSDIRKQTFQRMIKNFTMMEEQFDEKQLIDPLKLMIVIYLCEDKTIPHKVIQRCRLNPMMRQLRNRTDIQFYIPQICNFLVFHQQLKYTLFMDDMVMSCRLNYFFGHLYYFYMNSLAKVISKDFQQNYGQVKKYNSHLLDLLCKQFEDIKLVCNDFYSSYKSRVRSQKPALADNMFKYGTMDEDQCNKNIEIEADDIALPNYASIFSKQQIEPYSFKSTINFFEDLFAISADIKDANPKIAALKPLLKKMNERLPAQVYVPFTSNNLRLWNVLNIQANESRVYSTKERAPYYVCLEIFNPAEQLTDQEQKKLYEAMDKPITIRSTKHHNSEGTIDRRSMDEPPMTSIRHTVNIRESLNTEYKHQTEILDGRMTVSPGGGKLLTNKLLQFSSSMEKSKKADMPRDIEMNESDRSKKYSDKLGNIFGEKQSAMAERIRAKSIYGGLKTWQLLHMMVKTGDNLKQQQFALQLIMQFNYIFKLQSVPLLLTPYEVVSMGPDCGILEMLKDTVTIDGLLKKLKEDHPRIHSLKQFFQAFYLDDLHKAKTKFMKSLAGYSLAMYFMQVKDRHNGNILLHRQGKIIHIDFGFFLSNAPGKGVELEKSAPFKLNSQYVEVLDGYESSYFEEFRKLFYQGFQAARKHQDKILILVKMMYASSGSTMPCFQKGQQTIRELERRFNPVEIDNDLKLSEHCQQLINLSLDNWATRWYDKWQYWAQGIFY